MFALFFSLYMAMFYGTWTNYSLTQIGNSVTAVFNKVTYLLSSILADGNATIEYLNVTNDNVLTLTAYVLALITSIGIVVMAVKGIKKVFSVFFMGIRR